MAARWVLFLLSALLLPPAVAAAPMLLEDPAGDVTLSGADLRAVGVSRADDATRVTLRYGGALPLDVEVRVVFQTAPEPDRVAVLSLWRAVSDRGPTPTLVVVDAEGRSSVAPASALFAEDALLFVVPSASIAPSSCFALRSVRSTHHATDGALLTDTLDATPDCGTAPAAQTEVAESYALPPTADVPAAPAVVAVLVLALVAISRRR